MDPICSTSTLYRAPITLKASSNPQIKSPLFLDGCLLVKCRLDKRSSHIANETKSLVLARHQRQVSLIRQGKNRHLPALETSTKIFLRIPEGPRAKPRIET